MKYIKQLDSLRAIAVICVIISHWSLRNSTIHSWPLGPIGVDIFFVLSGFLITKILLDSKERAELGKTSKVAVTKNFYIRRTLRIFPIYYLLLFVLIAIAVYNGAPIRKSFIAHATYTSNIFFYIKQNWEDGTLAHLWSLSVEEQFYLIWPWIIIYTKKEHHLKVISSMIVIGIVSQFMILSNEWTVILTFTCLDAFGLGALLAWQITVRPERLTSFYRRTSIFAGISVLIFILTITINNWPYNPLRTIVSVIALWVITYIYLNQKAEKLNFGFILNNSVLIFLGKISYGIYLYHLIIPELNLRVINIFINPLLPDWLYKQQWQALFWLENSILLIITAWLSFELIEKRFILLKKHFNPVD